MPWDVVIVESGNGGDITMNGNDVAVCENNENDIYLRMFGGNVTQNSKASRKTGDMDYSYWGNKLLFNNDPAISFNSDTERVMNTTPLTSAGRSIIENAIKKDLSGLNVDVVVSIINTDRINVVIKDMLAPGENKIKKFSFVRNPLTGDFDLNDFDNNDFF